MYTYMYVYMYIYSLNSCRANCDDRESLLEPHKRNTICENKTVQYNFVLTTIRLR